MCYVFTTPPNALLLITDRIQYDAFKDNTSSPLNPTLLPIPVHIMMNYIKESNKINITSSFKWSVL